MTNRSRIPNCLGVSSVLASAAFVLTACSGGASQSATDSGSEGSDSASGSDTVSVAEVGGRSVLATPDGLPLYMAQEEQARGDVLCVSDGCVAFWEPLTIESGTPTGNTEGELGTVKRPDGATQVTLDDVPLYTFADDSSGQISGDGLSDTFDGQTLTWQVVETTGGTAGADQGDGMGSGNGGNTGGGDGGIYDY
jgi:predicted lipoprotein with Yx(FWY)xxD motif